MKNLKFYLSRSTYLVWVVSVTMGMSCIAQNTPNKELKFLLNEDGSHYIKSAFTGQIWLRYMETNPGTTVNGFEQSNIFDIGIRRARAQFFGKITDKVFFYSQIGINNFGYNSQRKPGLFFHDLAMEYAITKRSIHLGAGLTGWTGFLRYSSPAVASILPYDAPLYQQATNDVNDQFLRKLSIYVKGKLNKLDYRIVLSKPMLIDSTITSVKKINTNADFSYKPPALQTSGYLMFQLLEEESNLLPYTTGSYLGKKNVLNIGAGFQFQPDAVWYYGDMVTKDTFYQDMLHVGLDLFYDTKVGSSDAALTTYLAVSHTDYGKDYSRNLAPMNPGNANSGTSFNGGGNAYPMVGTGKQIYGQLGYLLPSAFFKQGTSRFQPYADFTFARYTRLKSDMVVWNIGLNWLLDGHRSKITLNYQNRPIFATTDLKESDRKGMVVLQMQFAL